MRQRLRKLLLVAVYLTPFALIPLCLLYSWGKAHVLAKTGDPRWKPNCYACHIATGVKSTRLRKDLPYRSPCNIAVSPDGSRLYVTASGCAKLLVLDAAQRRLLAEIPVGPHPQGVCLSPDGKTAYVSNRWASTVSVVDVEGLKVTGTLQVGDCPAGLALSPDGRTLFVANSQSNDVSVVDLATGIERRRLEAGRDPFGVVRSSDGRRIYVTNRLSNPVSFRTPPQAELTIIDCRPAHHGA